MHMPSPRCLNRIVQTRWCSQCAYLYVWSALRRWGYISQYRYDVCCIQLQFGIEVRFSPAYAKTIYVLAWSAQESVMSSKLFYWERTETKFKDFKVLLFMYLKQHERKFNRQYRPLTLNNWLYNDWPIVLFLNQYGASHVIVGSDWLVST